MEKSYVTLEQHACIVCLTPDESEITRTRDIIHIREHVFEQIFNVPKPHRGVAFVEPGVIQHLKELVTKSSPPQG